MKKFEYVGNTSCEYLSMAFKGDKVCSFGCLGEGSCSKRCPAEAIKEENGVAVVKKALCIGCGACAKGCPKSVIELVPKRVKVYVACSSKCKGKEVMTACKTGCIGCGLCAKNCPENAITLVDNLAVIDYSKCTGCKTCVAKCPRKIIKEL
jgi:Fe-S-cluster-containing hydrogenase component 2